MAKQRALMTHQVASLSPLPLPHAVSPEAHNVASRRPSHVVVVAYTRDFSMFTRGRAGIIKRASASEKPSMSIFVFGTLGTCRSRVSNKCRFALGCQRTLSRR